MKSCKPPLLKNIRSKTRTFKWPVEKRFCFVYDGLWINSQHGWIRKMISLSYSYSSTNETIIRGNHQGCRKRTHRGSFWKKKFCIAWQKVFAWFISKNNNQQILKRRNTPENAIKNIQQLFIKTMRYNTK